MKMKKKKVYTKWIKSCRLFLEHVYLFFLALFIVQEFLEYSMFPIDWKAPFGSLVILNNLYLWLFESPQYILSVIVIARIFLLKKFDWKYLLASAGVFLCVRYAWLTNRNVNILFFALLIIGAKEISFKRIVKVHLCTLGILLAITISASMIGIVDQVSYVIAGRRTRYAFGMTYPTNFATYIFYLILYYWYCRREKILYREIAIIAAIGVSLLLLCDARCTFICVLLTVIAMCYCKSRWKTDMISALLALSTPLAAVFWMGLTLLFDSQNNYFQKIDDLVSSRLTCGKKGADIYGFHLWGQEISMNGNGEGILSKKYFFLDSSYMQFGIIYGIVILGFILLAFLLIGYQARKDGEWVLLCMLALVSIHSMIEHHMLEISNCSLILAVFAERGIKTWQKEIDGEKRLSVQE